MTTSAKSSSYTILGIIAFLEWFSLIAQLILIFENSSTSTAVTLLNYFSYFTILTNALVALYCTVMVLQPSSGAGRFFSRPATATAVTVYIAVVGTVYNAVLRFLWTSGGMQALVHELLHTFIPLAFVAYWFFFVAKKELTWTSFFPWLIYPFVYCLYVLARGAYCHVYPYPFMNVDALGLPQVILNSLLVTAVFLGFSLLFIGIGKIKKV